MSNDKPVDLVMLEKARQTWLAAPSGGNKYSIYRELVMSCCPALFDELRAARKTIATLTAERDEARKARDLAQAAANRELEARRAAETELIRCDEFRILHYDRAEKAETDNARLREHVAEIEGRKSSKITEEEKAAFAKAIFQNDYTDLRRIRPQTHPAKPEALPDMPCWICGKRKGQPPERCLGHYLGTPSEPMKEQPKMSADITIGTIHTSALMGAPDPVRDAVWRAYHIVQAVSEADSSCSCEVAMADMRHEWPQYFNEKEETKK